MSRTRMTVYSWSRKTLWAVALMYALLISTAPALIAVSHEVRDQSSNSHWDGVTFVVTMLYAMLVGVAWLYYPSMASQSQRKILPYLHAATLAMLLQVFFSYYVAVRLGDLYPSIPNWITDRLTLEVWWIPCIIFIIVYGTMIAARRMPKNFMAGNI